MKTLSILLLFVAVVVGNNQTKAKEEAPFVFATLSQQEDSTPDTVSYTKLGRLVKGQLVIEHEIDLKGKVCFLPKGVVLGQHGGVLKNGTVVGRETAISGNDVLFNKVTIKGTWNVPQISTALFADLRYENSLKDVVALSNPKIKNTIIIEKGDYQVRARKSGDVCVPLSSNTDFILNGTIRLAANNYKSYNIVRVKGSNIRISGKGTIIGDKHTHTGTTGEWGMGIRFTGAKNVSVCNITIKDCWGDCIYVGGNSKNVLIEKCRLDHGRRQGISVTKANGVTIRKCVIKNVSGTNPQYAIDVEPNKRDSVDNILIEGVTVKDCEGGILVCRSAQKDGVKVPWIGSVTIRNCNVTSKSRAPVRVMRCNEVKVEKCTLFANKGRIAISVSSTGNAIVRNNKVSVDGGMIETIKSNAKKILKKGNADPISVKVKGRSIIEKNEIIKR